MINKKHFSFGSVQVALYICCNWCEGFWKMHQHIAGVNSALAIVKEVNKSCRATEPTASWKKASKIAQPDGIRYFLYVVRNYEELVGKPERA